jgi:hypothetical protein
MKGKIHAMDNHIDDEKENQHNQVKETKEKIQHIYVVSKFLLDE